ncbi:2-succinyl-5-enolpyruvyl-6-hydroxy-3-cyclohexene-1-carboxylic-acid synthase [Brachybacterium muris]|uniref:2-succinyl-5-enolpyruvyl-6-hydroxy-3- cyclohexene-1-carboxylic-acid synthase n=1 Tax=Brachybacterium muris TaxID=219301 RepID=UPI00223C14DE|nr:2-succinyl-5-enolpyruvyl-6-hydroxy-3-cyclohexene-1-carboxylic-acid synthase [Brachybacterium muris]MCT2294717.1 2-succinyl-5-enolpyruvyl-6-hydroxy-3-cyclohexene-1-carboxylic-acid synthase [Brachybacterium muris]
MREAEDSTGTSHVSPPVPTGSGAVDEAVVLWRALGMLGVREAVIAPGSRSAPLVYALADEQVRGLIRPHVRIDERAAAFTALGISRHDPAHPAAVATTSGTATAHLLAAVMEAHHSRVPLIVLTADRPAELRGTGANQTTHQVGLYREFVRFEADLPAPTAEQATPVELRTAVTTIARAVAAATGAHPGPVHLNLGFRDPLVPAPDEVQATAGDLVAEAPPIILTRHPRPSSPRPHPVPVSERTVVVAGDSAGPAARSFAERHRLPLLAEPSSGCRDGDMLVPGYPALLRTVMADPEHPLRPDRAVVFGHPTLSRPVLGSLLGAEDVEVVVVDPTADWPDAAGRASLVVPAAVGEDPAGSEELAQRRTRVQAWRSAARSDAARPLDWQVAAALAVWDATEEDDVLVLGSSSLVRDLEQYAGGTRGRVIANRGLAGIDGTTAVATGIALARKDAPGRVRLLVGDLTALHDLTGLIIGPEEPRPDLDVVVVDDGGGRIFGGLEHAAAPAALLRRFFTTPHGADIAAAARALGADAAVLGTDDLGPALRSAPAGIRVLVVQELPSGRPPVPPTEVIE